MGNCSASPGLWFFSQRALVYQYQFECVEPNTSPALCFLALDLGIYVQHVLFHRFEWLGRWHRVHHTDLDFDVTTAIRFHPVEIILAMSIKMVVVVLLGAPPIAVLLFEVVLSLTGYASSAQFGRACRDKQ